MSRNQISRRSFVQLVAGALASAYTLGQASQAKSEYISHPSRAGNPYHWVGMYTVANKIGCGFLIEDEFVLTAGHCLFFPPLGTRDLSQEAITFYPATSGLALSRPEKPYGGYRVTNTLLCPEWRDMWRSYNGSMPQSGYSQYDWALMKIARSPGIGHFGLGADIEVGDSVNVTGYPNGVSPNNYQQTHSGTVRYLTNSQIGVSGFIGRQWGGMSGGPLFVRQNSGWRAVGIHSCTETASGTSSHPRVNDYVLQAIRSFSG